MRSAFGYALDGWRLGLQAVIRMPRLFSTGLAAMLLVGAFKVGLTVLAPHVGWMWVLLSIVLGAAPASVMGAAVQRGVVLNEWHDHFVWEAPACLPFYYVGLVAVQLVWAAQGWIANLFGHALLAQLVLMVAAYLIYIQTLLLFPAIATDAPNASFHAAWRDSAGKLRRMTMSMLLANLPLWLLPIAVVLVVAASAAARMVAAFNGGNVYTDGAVTGSLIAGGLGGVALMALLTPVRAAISALFYRDFASDLNSGRQAPPPLFEGLVQPRVGLVLAGVLAALCIVDRSLPAAVPAQAHPHASGLHAAAANAPSAPAVWVPVREGVLPDGTLLADRDLPRGAILPGNDDKRYAVCRIRFTTVFLVGETSPGGCTVSLKGRDTTLNTFDIATGLGHWGAPGAAGALNSGGDYAVVCRADMWVRRPVAIAAVAGQAPDERTGREDRGQHAGQLLNDGRCHFAYQGVEYTTESYELFYP